MSKKKLIIFTDSGDTIIDEGSEKRPYDEIVYEAECIPGAKETYQRLKKEGYTLILVADGYTESFDRVYRFQQLEDLFDARVTSEAVGAEKPSAKMFAAAMKAAGLTGRDKKRILMVGNNLSRDILGANRFGITSVLMRWSPRYPMEPETEEETPDYIINTPSELEALAARLEAQLEEEELAFALKYCPYIFFDKKEPIPLRRIGYQVFTSTSPSDSFPRTVQVKNGETVIEYAFFWDYDIQHMYDLEHIWVTVGSAGQICGCQASFHGQRLNMMWDRDNSLKIENQTHVCLYSQPGKHAFMPHPDLFHLYPGLYSSCMEEAGIFGLDAPAPYRKDLPLTASQNQIIKEHIRETYAFCPSMEFVRLPVWENLLCPWESLKEEIPQRLKNECIRLGILF